MYQHLRYMAHIPEYKKFYKENKKKLKKKQKAYNYMLRYGISEKEVNKKIKKQKGCCAICGDFFGKKLCVDHDHTTGEVRDMLCNKCNQGLGNANDSILRLTQMVVYIKKHENKKNMQVLQKGVHSNKD